jgi:ribosomal protein S18 acetylase RimI-like enzyme
VDGCEFSISSFFIAFYNDKPVGAVGGWAEGLNTDISSNLIKSNLINYLFPKDNVIKAQAKLEMIKELLQIERPAGTYQIEYGYVDNEHRGKLITNMLMDEHFANAKRLDSNIKAVQVSCFETNVTSIRMHEKNGFRQVRRFVCNNEEVLNYMPHNVKVLLEKKI